MQGRICFVVQRYGLEVNGGAELHCRQLAEHMLRYYNEVDVVTSKALDYVTWEDYYQADKEEINGINVIRFGVKHTRDQEEFEEINGCFAENRPLPVEREDEWVDKEGPCVPKLLDYLKDNHDKYDAFVFFTYIYYPTVLGVPLVADKAIVIPTAHDEPYLSMEIFKNVFCRPRAFLYNTEEERQLINRKFKNSKIPSELGGVGVDLPQVVNGKSFREKYNLGDSPYLIYVGRIDEGKNCGQMFNFFLEYKHRHNTKLKLLLVGKKVMDIPQNEDIIELGFVSDEDKFNGIAAANALILPSRYESLSMVVLEAMSLKTLVLVNGECEVLKGHCTKSNGALYYKNYFEFEGCLEFYRDNPEKCEIMKRNALNYVNEHYQWDVITQKLDQLIKMIQK